MLYEGQSQVALDQLRPFVTMTVVDDPIYTALSILIPFL